MFIEEDVCGMDKNKMLEVEAIGLDILINLREYMSDMIRF